MSVAELVRGPAEPRRAGPRARGSARGPGGGGGAHRGAARPHRTAEAGAACAAAQRRDATAGRGACLAEGHGPAGPPDARSGAEAVLVFAAHGSGLGDLQPARRLAAEGTPRSRGVPRRAPGDGGSARGAASSLPESGWASGRRDLGRARRHARPGLLPAAGRRAGGSDGCLHRGRDRSSDRHRAGSTVPGDDAAAGAGRTCDPVDAPLDRVGRLVVRPAPA